MSIPIRSGLRPDSQVIGHTDSAPPAAPTTAQAPQEAAVSAPGDTLVRDPALTPAERDRLRRACNLEGRSPGMGGRQIDPTRLDAKRGQPLPAGPIDDINAAREIVLGDDAICLDPRLWTAPGPSSAPTTAGGWNPLRDGIPNPVGDYLRDTFQCVADTLEGRGYGCETDIQRRTDTVHQFIEETGADDFVLNAGETSWWILEEYVQPALQWLEARWGR